MLSFSPANLWTNIFSHQIEHQRFQRKTYIQTNSKNHLTGYFNLKTQRGRGIYLKKWGWLNGSSIFEDFLSRMSLTVKLHSISFLFVCILILQISQRACTTMKQEVTYRITYSCSISFYLQAMIIILLQQPYVCLDDSFLLYVDYCQTYF